MMHTRSMRAPRRIETDWPQTVQVERRALRTRDNPYRKRDTRESGKHVVDWIVLAMFVGTVVWLWWPSIKGAFQ